MIQKELTSYQQLVDFTLKNGGVIIVKFYNNDSVPCKLIEPHLNNFAQEYKIAVASIEAEKNDEVASKFNIFAVPTFFLVKKSGGEIQKNNTVISAHVQKLKKLFQLASDIKNLRK